MANFPLVSIIIPSWNTAQYIKDAVDSALAQTYPTCEVIVVDDGSTDNTKEILQPYIDSKKIIYIYQENSGLAGARNAGMKMAQGKYVAFLDSDDLFIPEKIAAQVEALESRPEYGICYSDIMHFTDASVTEHFHHAYHHRYPSGNIFEPLLHKQLINPLAVMVRKEVLDAHGVFDETLRRSEDWDLWLRFAHAGVKFFYLDKILARYRIRSVGNLSSLESEPQMKEKNLFIFERLGRAMTPHEWEKYHFENVLRTMRAKVAFAHLMVGDKKKALDPTRKLPLMWRVMIGIFPAAVWKMLLARARRMKHRLLLKKM